MVRTSLRRKKTPQGPPPEIGEGSKVCSLPGYVKRALQSTNPSNEKCTDLRANYNSCSIKVIPEHIYKNEELVTLLTELVARHNVIKKMQPYINLCYRLKVLDLSNNLLTVIPKDVLKLDLLEHVDFSGNRIKKVPAWQKLPRLLTCNFSRNKIKKLKGALFTSKSINRYNFSHNFLKSLPKQIYKQPTVIDLSFNKITSLPRVPEKGSHHLNGLDVSNNKLKQLPPRFGTLACLASLDISHNMLSFIEEDLHYTIVRDGDLVHKTVLVHLPYYITSLNISHNSISSFGNRFIKLRGMRSLNASSNKISLIPKEFVKLDCLIELNVSNNKIEDIDKRLDTMNNLKHIYLNENEIQSFGSLWTLNNCEILDISYNLIKVIPNEIEEMYELKEFRASNNHIEEIPDSIGQIASLKTLDLAHNSIAEIPHSLGVAQLLKNINLSYNELLFLPNDLRKWRTLESLNLEHNSLTSVQRNFHSVLSDLTEFNISQNSFSEITVPKSVKHLVLADNPFHHIDKVLTGKLLLDKLFIHDLNLQDLPNHLGHYRTLTHLDVSQNSLSILAGEIMSSLKNLQVFNCSQNELLSLPHELTMLPNLTYLDCSNNQIAALNENLLACPLQHLNASHNRLTELNIHHVKGTNLSTEPLAFQLKYLNISHNQITEFFRSNLHLYASLETILASHNHITWIHPHITYLYYIKTMDFDNNDLLILPKSFEKMTSLTTLLLHDNLLQNLPESLCKIPTLTHLDVSFNKIFNWSPKWPKFLTVCEKVVYDKQRTRKREPKVPPENMDEITLLMAGKEVHATVKQPKKAKKEKALEAIAAFQANKKSSSKTSVPTSKARRDSKESSVLTSVTTKS